jgi:hypothetical protein
MHEGVPFRVFDGCRRSSSYQQPVDIESLLFEGSGHEIHDWRLLTFVSSINVNFVNPQQQID